MYSLDLLSKSSERHPEDLPTISGAFSSQGVFVMASTASAPPTPIANAPKPPAFGVCESVESSILSIDTYSSIHTCAKPERTTVSQILTSRSLSLHEHARCSVVLENNLMDNA